MATTTVAGSSLAISIDTPGSHDVAGYAALSFTDIGGVEKIGTAGAVYAKVNFQPLKGGVQKRKGSADYGALALSVSHDDADAGQAILRTASDDATSKLYAFRVTYPTGAIRYFRGRAFGYPETIEGADTIIMAAPTIEISTRVIKSDPSGLPTVALSGAQSQNEGNSGTTVFTYTVTRSSNAGAVSVPWSFAAGSTSADDFAGGSYPTGGNVSIADGQTTGTFSISVAGDTSVEPDEQFTVTIAAPSGYFLGTRSSATGTIVNDDAAPTPTVSLSSAQSQNEGNSGNTIFTFTVTRSDKSGTIGVPWSFAAGSTSADDFTGGNYPAGGTVSIANGQTSGTFAVSVAGDAVVEPDEQFTVSISAPSGYALGTPSSATGTILNDDASSSISSVNADGWSSEWASGTPPTFAPDTSPQTVSVTRQGFSNTGAAMTYSEQRTFTKRVRQPWPNNGQLTATRVALDDYVYASDTISGVTNNSSEACPKPVALFVTPDRRVVGNTIGGTAVPVELVAAHRDARNGRQVASVIFDISDGSQTISVTVNTTTVSPATYDKHAVIVYSLPSTDISSLAAGAITVNARVFPWIGTAAAIANSATDGNARRGFSPRYFLKDVALAAAPIYAYLSSSGTSGGTISTNPATAAAAPFDTLANAYNAMGSYVTANGLGGFDNFVIRVGSGTFVLTVASTSRATRLALVTIERDPAVARANAVVTFGAAQFLPRLANTSLVSTLGGRWRFRDITVQRTGTQPITGTGAGTEIEWENTDLLCNSYTSNLLTTGSDYWFGGSVTGNSGNSMFGPQTVNEHRLYRGLSLALSGGSGELWAWIGCDIFNAGGITVGSSGRTPTGSFIAFNRIQSPNGGATAFVYGADFVGAALIQNVFEWTSTTSGHPTAVSNDSASNNGTHFVQHNNTYAGYWIYGRENLDYDEGPTPRTNKLASRKGNLHCCLATKGDVFRGTNESNPEGFTTDSPSTRVGNWSYLYGVGCVAEFTQYTDANGGGFGTSFAQAYPGLRANHGTSTTARNDPLFVDHKATTNQSGSQTPVAGAGGGNYAVQSGSPVKAMLPTALLSHDFVGTARNTTNDTTGAYA